MRAHAALATRVIAAHLAAVVALTPVAYGQSVESCPETSDPGTWSGATLETGTSRDGVIYDDTTGGRLQLERAAGLFAQTTLGIEDLTVFTAVADFDKDGWDDFVGAGEARAFVRIYENRTYRNPEPDWDDPTAFRTPRFDYVRSLIADDNEHRWRPTVAADFNGDTWPDVFVAIAETYERPSEAWMFLNRASNSNVSASDPNGNARFLAAYQPMSNTQRSNLGHQNWGGKSIQAFDWNHDRKMDILIGSAENNGTIRIFLNQCPTSGAQPAAPALLRCSSNPTFAYTNTLISNLGSGGTNEQGALPVFHYARFNADAYPDLIVGAPSLGTLRYYPGQSGGGLNTGGVRSISTSGGVTAIYGGDYSQDGRLDIVVAHDNWNYNAGGGGRSFYHKNNGADFPFPGGFDQQLTEQTALTYDFDTGFVFDYDHDPSNTPDIMVADGNHSASFYVLANRVVEQYVDCGEAASGVMDIGALAGSEMVVTGARIDPDVTLAGGTVSYYLSNEEPANWVLANDCGDGSGDLCATFPKGSGRDVRWRAVMCSNDSHTQTPQLRSISARFDYTEATEHYRSGVVVNDGVSYVGAFRQPGDRGKFYAINAGLDTTYWEAASKLDALADGSRRIYTAHADTGERLDFSHSAGTVDIGLISTLGAADATQAAEVIDWVRSARFGVGNAGIARSKLGAVETSTPAILTRPGLPTWYVFATSEQRTKVDQFLQAQDERFNLVLFGSKDGMVHAVHSRPTDISNPRNGQEAWAYVPPEIAAGMVADYSSSLGGDLQVSAYPDGSPTLADVADDAGNMATVAIVAGGNGGKSVAAIDVTETIDPDDETQINGPTPLWSTVPGGSAAGQAFSKVAVGRTRIDGETRFVAIAGTGVDFDDLTAPFERGREIWAYDVLTGDALWKFQTRCPLTSDVTLFETDDDAEPGAPTIDGYIDRAVFSDRCGNVYKVDPAQDLGGGWNANPGLGAIAADVVDGNQLYALFSTAETEGALAAESPIAGTVGAQIEPSTNRLVLFFGTGGVESHPPDQANAFYAVYADTGEIRATLAGACDDGVCEKFYGGVVVTQEQVLFTKTMDPSVGSGTCDRGSSVVQAVQLNGVEDGELVTDFARDVGAAVMGSLYGDAGAVYFANLSGDVVRIGEPRAPDAGGDSNATGGGTGSGTGSAGTMDPDEPMTLMGWRQVF